MKLHYTEASGLNPCTARLRKCPLGAAAVHFNSAEEAHRFFTEKALDEDMKAFEADHNKTPNQGDTP